MSIHGERFMIYILKKISVAGDKKERAARGTED